ncbi:DUF4188 domain-containing protein [Streptomyces sp. DSM 44915]|uniref:DUF4188 domain-containing protein n=1 Tax=Streptomyces chisholmiae TaxID=3075540 RepID=A0ABU2JXA7_9ACTN|nr:DUF4188 domain-containing protein [Streptomyces sp. DSM 44915]MDT0269379.1 DUF4188 domain-containing protein [Streptomyces sp. DSM 44915]
MGAKVVRERMTARADEEIVMFLVGMRITRFWRVDEWLPVLLAMPRMLRELSRERARGMLGYRLYLGFARELTVVQYWSGVEPLLAYATAADAAHRPAWAELNRRLRAGSRIGFWHETFVVPAGSAEAIYRNMPPSGLAAATELIPAGARGERLAERLRPARGASADG